jgi:hypothetical protein
MPCVVCDPYTGCEGGAHHAWRSRHGWPVLNTDKSLHDVYSAVTLPRWWQEHAAVELWDGGCGGSQYLWAILHVGNLYRERMQELHRELVTREMWYTIEPSWRKGAIMIVMMSEWAEWYS